MKLQSLLEAYVIPYDAGKKKNTSSVIDFIKENGITPSDTAKTLDIIKKTKEFQFVLDCEFEYKSSALQEKRGVAYFESSDGNTQLTFYPTGQVREANRGGFRNSQFLAKPIPTEAPVQVGDLPTVVDVMTANLKMGLKSYADLVGRRNKRGADGLDAVDVEMRKINAPTGLRIYLDGAPKKKIFEVDEGVVYCKAPGSSFLVIDFGDLPDVGDFSVHDVEGITRITIRGNNIKSFKGLEAFFKVPTFVMFLDAEGINMRELAKVAPEKTQDVYFKNDPRKYPLLSVPKLFTRRVDMWEFAHARIKNNQQVIEILNRLNAIKKGDGDELDLQDWLLDNNLNKCAKP